MNETQTATRMPNLDMPVNGPLVAQQEQTAPVKPSSFRNLATALAAARDRCKPATHDRRNKYLSYNYTSAEEIIATAKEALQATGLAVIPIETTVQGWERTGEERFELHRKLLLCHDSGEQIPIIWNWPIVIEKGKNLGQASAIADTSSLGYFYRDLLCMPRTPDEEPKDSEALRKPQEANQTLHEAIQESAPTSQYLSPEQISMLMGLVEASGVPLETVLAAEGKIPGLYALPADQFDRVKAKLEVNVAKKRAKPDLNGPVSTKTIDEIAGLRQKWKIPETAFFAWAHAWYKVQTLREMTEMQGRELLQQMKESEATLKDAAKCAAFLSQYQKGDFAQKKTAEN